MIERVAHAKINLALHVTGQREDGYHLIDSLVVFSEFGDRIFVEKPHHPHGPVSFSMDGPFADGLSSGPENLAASAILMLRNKLLNDGQEPAPVAVHLEKNLPVASGIGGGSADAAAALLALAEYWNAAIDLTEFAHVLGSDVAMCMKSRPLRAQGTGNDIAELQLDAPIQLLLVNPRVALSTPSVFSALETKQNGAITELELTHMPEISNIANLRNDLQVPATKLQPVIETVLSTITDSGAALARMSGSGASCFGIYETADAARAACEALKQTHPDWWCVSTETTVS